MSSPDRPASLDVSSDGRVNLRFPRSFEWGAGTSAHQFEGDNTNSDWWAFEQTGAIARGEVSGKATDLYHRFAEDFSIARSLNLNAIKLSVEWARVEPEPGRFDEAALRHYEEVVESLASSGLEPFVVLHHFTSPLWLERYGWWEGRETALRFAAYSTVVAERLARWVRYWMPINEPLLLALQGYGLGAWPPRIKGGILKARKVSQRLVDAHRLSRDAIRSVRPDAQVGAAVNTVELVRAGDSAREKALHRLVDWVANWWFLDKTAGASDFVGVQYYSRLLATQLIRGAGLAEGEAGLEGTTDLGWPIYSEGLYRVVREAAKRYECPIYITENGLADADDSRRAPFIVDHLAWLHRAMREGVDVRGYFHWALTDNFEWLEGFEPRFGLVAVDYTDLSRTVRPSARVYAEIAGSCTLTVDPGHPSLAEDVS